MPCQFHQTFRSGHSADGMHGLIPQIAWLILKWRESSTKPLRPQYMAGAPTLGGRIQLFLGAGSLELLKVRV